MEHHSNIVPWHFIRERQGAKLVFAPVDDEGTFHIEEFEKRLTERTRLVAITHMSNALGTVTPIKKIVELAHARGIPVLVDGSQGAVHLPVDVQDLGCDWYVFTGHKVYGPSGIGVLYGRSEMLEKMRPFQGGGEMIEEVTEEYVTYNHPPHRFRQARLRLFRLSVLAQHLNIWKRSAVTRFSLTRRTCVITPTNSLDASTACAFWQCAGQGSHHLICA